jgi:hypothetical protein
VDEAGSCHRFDGGGHLLAVTKDVGSERAQGVRVRADGGHLDGLTVLIEDVDIEALAR